MIGTVMGHYRILSMLGEGGMGTVYRAFDERLEREVAVKVLIAGATTDETARRRFRKEALAPPHNIEWLDEVRCRCSWESTGHAGDNVTLPEN